MREFFLGCPIDILTMTETVELARGSMRDRMRLQHVALNVAKLVNSRSDTVLAADVANSDLVGIDGMGIVWGARLLGLPVTERVAGIDLLSELLAVCANDGFRPYFLGATRETVQQAATRVLAKHPAIRFAGAERRLFHTRHRSPRSSTRSATAARIACSSACRPRARSGFSHLTGTS